MHKTKNFFSARRLGSPPAQLRQKRAGGSKLGFAGQIAQPPQDCCPLLARQAAVDDSSEVSCLTGSDTTC